MIHNMHFMIHNELMGEQRKPEKEGKERLEKM